jgi:hypothetical protein
MAVNNAATAGNIHLFPDGGGNVGIGTSSPGRLLSLYKTSTPILQFIDAVSGTGASNGFLIYNAGLDAYLQNTSSGFMAFYTNDTERMRITSGGQVYVGLTSGLNGTLNSTTLSGQFALSLFDGFGNNAMVTIRNSSNAQVGSIVITGGGTTTTYNTTSDYRLKEDLKEINGLEKLSAIKVYNYKWKSCNERMDGVLAHELAEILPYAVHGEKDGEEMQGVDYSKIVPILVKAIQEQTQIIKDLEARIKQLENK